MYLKKVNGPRAVTLPDGNILSCADLPPENTVRWVASRKLKVVKAIDFGLLSEGEAKSKYDLSDDELDEWRKALQKNGREGLKATRQQRINNLK